MTAVTVCKIGVNTIEMILIQENETLICLIQISTMIRSRLHLSISVPLKMVNSATPGVRCNRPTSFTRYAMPTIISTGSSGFFLCMVVVLIGGSAL